MKKYIFFMMCFIFHNNNAGQFVYPVADFDDGNQLMVLYQKSLDCVELWIWDTKSQHATKGLSSFLTPANLRMMPSGKGFSFIDQGYIKIKEFIKRSPRTLPIYEPIGLFSHMSWIDDETFYFVAREGDFSQIFQGDLQANICRLTCQTADTLYPQKINTKLFYIERDMNNQASIVMQSWNPLPMHTYNDALDYHVIIPKTSRQLCFLHMISEEEGFFLQAPTKKANQNKNNNSYTFSCHHLKHQDNQWHTQQLFSFAIPSQYLIGSTRLYESLEPFLPNYTIEDMIYFVSLDEEKEKLQLYTYNITTKVIENMQQHQDMYRKDDLQIFAPYIHKKLMHCGFILPHQRHINSFQKKFETNDVRFELPEYKLK